MISKEINIIFIQKLSWSLIQSIPSLRNCEGDKLVRVPNHSNWTTFSRNFSTVNNSPRVITYINIRLFSLHFSLWKDIFNHRDIFCVSFFNSSLVYFLINIYSDSLQIALKYLKNIEVNIDNILIMTDNFNIRNSSWDPNFLHYSIHRNTLIDVADSFLLELSEPTNCIPTRYLDNQYNSNSVKIPVSILYFVDNGLFIA